MGDDIIFILALGVCLQRLRQQRANVEMGLPHTGRVLVSNGYVETEFLYCV